MKQIIQNYSTGALDLAEVSIPICSSSKILVRNVASLISIGTERSIIELGRKSLLGKARARPDLVKRFMNKAKNEGFIKTFKEALGRLDNPTALGYSSAGTVVEVGSRVQEFSPGDPVACIGAGYASHAEFITLPPALCCKIPEETSFEEASFGMLGIIALHGIRCANLSFGSSTVVIGLGLLGLLSVQILKAYGCRVFGLDIDSRKAEMAIRMGADGAFASETELKSSVERQTAGHGVDSVVITAATQSNGPVNLAVDLAMFRGRVVLVGVADVHPQRNEMWHKEVEIVVSKAGGPGTFDPFYENKGMDYPAGYVRWTENRNLQEFLRLLSHGKVDVRPLVTHRFLISEALSAYEGFTKGTLEDFVGIVLTYPEDPGIDGQAEKLASRRRQIVFNPRPGIAHPLSNQLPVGVIGAGLFGKALLLPALKEIKGISLGALAASSSANAYHVGKKYGFAACTTDYNEIMDNESISAVVILTPHSLHAGMVCRALEKGKHVFVEKPMCVSDDELCEIISSMNRYGCDSLLMVGYNRRFSPHALKISEYFQNRHDPMVIHYRVNAGFVPADHWVHSEEEGGGRIIGEVCHFVDFMQHVTEANPVRVFAERICGNNRTSVNNDNLAINIKFSDGSVGNIVYSASGDKAFSRERIEIFCEGKTVVSTDFRETALHFAGKKKTFKTANQSMGYREELQNFVDSAKGKVEISINPEEIFYSTATVFSIHKSLAQASPCAVSLP